MTAHTTTKSGLMARIAMIALVTGGLAACGEGYSDGFRTGVIQKASRKGIVWKSFEGELVQDGVRSKVSSSDTGSRITTTNVWAFSATDSAVMDQLKVASDENAPVKLSYRQWFIAPLSQETGYTIYKVERIGQGAHSDGGQAVIKGITR